MTARPADSGSPALGHHVQVRAATKSYGPVKALSAASFDVDPGEFLVLLGPSGSGKSTLIRGLAGVETLDSGQIVLSGHTVSDGRRHVASEHRDLAMVFQDYALWPHLTVAGNVGYAMRRRRLSPTETRRRVHEALDRVGLAQHSDRYPHQLSGGEQQRVGLARAIVGRPRLLLFDEPLSNLDADLRERLRVEIATLTRESGATAVYITHDQAEAFALADKVGVLHHGQLRQLDTPEGLYQRPADAVIARFTGVAGECLAHTIHVDDHLVTVAVGSHQLTARAIGAHRVGQQVHLLIRPAATSLTDQEPGEATASPQNANSLDATVVDVAYRGRGYDHVVHCAVGVISAVHAPTARPRGSRVTLRLDPDHCLAYPDADQRLPPTPTRLDPNGSIPPPREPTVSRPHKVSRSLPSADLRSKRP